MEINKDNIEYSQIGDFQSIESSIRQEDMGLAFTMVSKNLYSNPIGSFIRELTSNAVDANVDADETSPVLIHIYRESGSYYIEVKDNGVGMSPEAFRDVYMKWFNSDKRDTNKKIGGWGLGSKSPLSYQDSFEITTRHNGIEYSYILSNTNNSPVADLLMDVETDKGNGTTIRVEINDEDLYKVSRECDKQLVYFNNVYVKNEIHFYNNNFKIYESDTFKLRNTSTPYGSEMHICLGQVAYPINWNVLELETVRIPVAIKFEIGELDVTLSREELNYTERVKKAITERITTVTADLIKKYEKQLHIADLFDYIKLIKNKNRPPLTIEDVSISMEGIKANIHFIPFEGLEIKGKSITDLFSAYNVTRLKGGKNYQEHGNSSNYYSNLYNSTDNCYLIKDKLDYFDSLYIDNAILFKRGKLTPYRYDLMLRLLNLVILPKTVTDKRIVKLGAAKTVKMALSFVDEYLDNKLKQYDGAAPKFWIDSLKQEAQEKKEKTKGEITYYNIQSNRFKVKLSKLIEDNKIVFYANKNDNSTVNAAYVMLYELGNKNFKQNSEFVIVSPTTIDKLQRFKNVYPADFMFNVNSYKHMLLTMRFTNEVKKLVMYEAIYKKSVYYNKMYIFLTKNYRKECSFMQRNVKHNDGSVSNVTLNLVEYYKKEISEIKLKKPLRGIEYYEPLKEIGERMDILRYFNHATPIKYISDVLIRNKALKFDTEWYHSSLTPIETVELDSTN